MSNLELKMTIKTLAHKGVANREIARTLNLSEGTVRYHLKRLARDATDGRARQTQLVESVASAIEHWRSSSRALSNTAALHDWLVTEHDYTGSLRSVQRYVTAHYPPPKRRTRAVWRRHRVPRRRWTGRISLA